jgi:dipeptidyl aminopeptidase/acylaminoacyl peptidase
MTYPGPYGTWPSPVTARDVAAQTRLGRVALSDDGALWWEETRPAEHGRIGIMRYAPGGEVERVYAAEADAAGIGGWLPMPDGGLVVTGEGDRRIYRLQPGRRPRPLTLEPVNDRSPTYTDLVAGPDLREIWAVREHRRDGLTSRQIVSVPLDGEAPVRPAVTTARWVSAPRPSPDGRQLAFLAWDEPQMPWDGTELCVGRITPTGLDDVRTLLGGPVESVEQPRWASTDSLYAVSDRTRWWNLYQVGLDGTLRALCPWSEEFGWPEWEHGVSTYDVMCDGRLAVLHGCGEWRLDLLDPATGTLSPLDLPYTGWQPSLSVHGRMAAGVAGTRTQPAAAVLVDTAAGEHRVIRRSTPDPHAEYLPAAHATTFTGRDGHQVHAVVYPPQHPHARADRGERVPYLLFLADGPGGQGTGILDLVTVFFTSRGLGVVHVHGRGSSGYGRTYREHLYGQWGVADVEDCAVVARGLAAGWHADPSRLVIHATGAAGATALAVLANTDACAAACVYGGISDLGQLAAQSAHPVVGYLREIAADSTLLRTPRWLDGVRRPVLICHGTHDRLVPVSQATLLIEALRRNHVPHTYLTFPGEGHMPGRPEDVTRALQAELSFYGQVLRSPAPGRPRVSVGQR